jgi:hypothetical protein
MQMRKTIVFELPETLMHQIETLRIPEEELRAVVVAAIEIWVAQRTAEGGETAPSGPFAESAVTFVRRLIAQNRALFEELARL